MAAPAVIYRTDRGRVVDEEELVYPTKMRTPPQQDYKVPQVNRVPRRWRRINLPSRVFGASNIVTLATVPVNAVWRWIMGRVFLTASGTAGTRNYALQWQDTLGNTFFRTNFIPATAGQLAEINFAPNLTTFGSVASSGVAAGIQAPAPAYPQPEGYVLKVLDGNNIDSLLDTLLFEAQVEEYSIPKGLAQGEIPMGLESGFQWDLSEVRQVA